MNAFEERRARRIERMRERAAGKRSEAARAHATAERIGNVIPMGQPILVGHHSEKRHRRDLKRIHSAYEKAWAKESEAQRLENRARAAEDNDAIFSDDPDAAEKLRAKIAKLEQEQERDKAINKAVRSKTPWGALAALGFTDGTIQRLLEPDCMGDVGIPRYRLTNRASNIRRLKERLGSLEKEQTRPEAEPEKIGDVTIEESDNRVRLIFPGKPSAEARALLKRYGFRWSPSAGAWQRHANDHARYVARQVVTEIGALS